MEFQAAFDDDKGTVNRPFGQYLLESWRFIFCTFFVDSIENLISFISRFIVRIS
jgi:hypothetical protein